MSAADRRLSVEEAIALANAPVPVRLAPCPVSCDLGDHPFVGQFGDPDALDREHRFVVGKTDGITGLAVAITVFEAITRGRTKLDTPRVAILFRGKVDLIDDLEPSEAGQLGALLQRAAELAAEVGVAL